MRPSQIAIEPTVPQIAEADAALAAADVEHAAGAGAGAAAELVTYIGRHAAGPNPAPREAPRVPRIRPRERVTNSAESLLSA